MGKMGNFLVAAKVMKRVFASEIEELCRNLAWKQLLRQEIKGKTEEISVKMISCVPYEALGWDYLLHDVTSFTRYDELKTVKMLAWRKFEDKVIAVRHNLNSKKMERLAQIWIIEIPLTKYGEKILKNEAGQKPIVRVKFFPPLEFGHCLIETFGDTKFDEGKKLIQELFERLLIIQEEETEPAEIEKIKKKEKIEEIEEEEKLSLIHI